MQNDNEKILQILEEFYPEGMEKPRLPWESDEEYDNVEPPFDE